MELEKRKKITLGIFVFLGLLIVTSVIYYMGTTRGLFGERIEVTANFQNVEGLREGNNVRFSGIKVGVVEEVKIINDSTVQAVMNIDEEAAQFIKKDSRAAIATQGLMGNKIISISSGSERAASVEAGDQLGGEEPVGMEDVFERIQETANEASRLTKNLADITEDIKSGKGPLGTFIYDTTLIERIDRSLALIETSGRNVRQFSLEINEMAQNINEGEGLATRLIHDESWARDVEATLDSLRKTGSMMAKSGRDLKIFTEKLNNEKGAIEKLLSDTTMARDLHQAIINIKQGTRDLDEAMHTLNSSWLLNLFSGDD